MRNKRRAGLIGLAICASLMMAPARSHAAESSVSVTLPDFKVKLNGNTVENQYRQYPLLVYKDITYFPMTWYDSRLLGLETTWTADRGLAIKNVNVTSSYHPYQKNDKNSESYKATKAAFGITINGQTVDTSKQEYPLLSFNNVTYFPMTWEFAHDLFGWNYAWDDSEGLTINSVNPQLKTLDLPVDAGDNDVAMFNSYYYFTETKGSTNEIYRVPINDMSNKELVYSYAVETGYGFQKYMHFEVRNNELWFSYHLGGATMGYDVYCKINSDGKASIEHKGYIDFADTSLGTLIVDYSVPPSGHNLSLAPPGKINRNDAVRIGDPNLIYGWHITGGGTSYERSSSAIVIEDDIFLLASSMLNAESPRNNIYKVNLTTNQTNKIIQTEVDNFKILDNKLYYVKDEDKCLYSSNMDGTNEQKWSRNKVANWYDKIDGTVYYTSADEQGAKHLYKAVPSGEETLILQDALESVQLVNDKLICKLVEGGEYGVKILDKSGTLGTAVVDQVSNIFAYNDTILMVLRADKSITLLK
ncbi:hypothetical protein QFZ77_006157 [Paenibacillus sp. V4I3]|uniref:DUF5050 domain-containing protein n=1 Tax=unclassified Paenibacillus TaxID=185978 RepID=UPI0027895E5D|nr:MULTISPECIES: DUF5050 domain-containing protein [unclassified Paenibacillus]MDQ0877498.1 hypothetical protein [Paenibacillus sp. V4I3]MDQ0886637.1 hypothetical protein [Paenibacillus sp. V4I9]